MDQSERTEPADAHEGAAGFLCGGGRHLGAGCAGAAGGGDGDRGGRSESFEMGQGVFPGAACAADDADPGSGGVKNGRWEDEKIRRSEIFYRACQWDSFEPAGLGVCDLYRLEVVMATLRIYDMKVVCAWCGKELGTIKAIKPGRVSHGMCEGCKPELMKKFEDSKRVA